MELKGESARSYLLFSRCTSSRRSVDIFERACAAFCDSVAPFDVLWAASATPEMFLVISPEPLAASPTFRAISLVVAFCSSTAVAMVLEMSLTCLITLLICAMASTAPLVSVWIAVDLSADVFGSFGGLLGEFFYLVGDDSEALAGLSRASRFDGRVERQ